MTQRIQISTPIALEIKQMLQHMAVDDLRTIKGQLEWLITQEYARRNAPHNKLVDAPPVEYVTEKERA